MKISTKKYHIWDWVSKLIQDWVFYHRLPVVKKCLEFPLVSEAIKEEWNMNTDCLSTGTLCWIIYNNGHKKCTRKL